MFIRQHPGACSTSAIQVQNILDEEEILAERGNEQLRDPRDLRVCPPKWMLTLKPLTTEHRERRKAILSL